MEEKVSRNLAIIQLAIILWGKKALDKLATVTSKLANVKKTVHPLC